MAMENWIAPAAPMSATTPTCSQRFVFIASGARPSTRRRRARVPLRRPRRRAQSASGSGNRRARRRADRRAGTRAGRHRPTRSSAAACATAPNAPATSVHTAPTIGMALVAAMWSGPLSPPMNSAARSTSARSSASEHSPIEHTLSRAAGASRCRARSMTRAAASRSDGPDTTITRTSAWRDTSVATMSANESCGQRRNGFPALTCTTTRRSVSRSPAAWSRAETAAAARGSTGISTGSVSALGGGTSIGVRRSHWFSTAWRGRSSRGRGHAASYTSTAVLVPRSRCVAGRRSATPAATPADRHGNRWRDRSAGCAAADPVGCPTPGSPGARRSVRRYAGCTRRPGPRAARRDRRCGRQETVAGPRATPAW